MRWHRAGFRRYWRWKSCSLGGRPQIGADLRALIRRMSVDNPLWGAPRIHGELLKLGFEVAQSSVAKYMVKRRGPPSPGWRAFITMRPTSAPWICSLPRPLASTCSTSSSSSDCSAENLSGSTSHPIRPRNGLHARSQRHSLGLSPALPDPRSGSGPRGCRHPPITGHGHPRQAHCPRLALANGFAERLIGSIRRECVDHVTVLGEAHLRRILTKYAAYNELRTHRSLGKDAPIHRAIQHQGRIASAPVVGGLHHHYSRI